MMILRSTRILWLMYIFCAVCLTLVYGQVPRYTKDQLLNDDLETIDKEKGMMKDWMYRNFYKRIRGGDQYNLPLMTSMQEISIESQDILNNLKKWVKQDSDYYRTMGKKNQDYFQNVHDYMNANAERIMISPGANEKQRSIQCVAIANTMFNSRLDLQRYYKVRYLYTWTLEFEIGYLCHEILRHYTVVIDLFHLVFKKFDKHRFDDHTPSRLMLYMYSVILQECKMVIKLCHMLREVERKYTDFGVHTKLWKEMTRPAKKIEMHLKYKHERNEQAWKLYNDQLEKARADHMKALLKRNKRPLQAFKGKLNVSQNNGKAVAGAGFGSSNKKGKTGLWQPKPADYFYGSVNASAQKKSAFPHIYGWSIENFPPDYRYK